MRAVYINEYGAADKLTVGELEKPEITASQVLVKVMAAGVNPVDFHVRNGFLAESGTHSLPLIPGWDVAGIVVACGSDVDTLKTGDEVFAFAPIGGQGVYAEYAALEAAHVVAKPESLDFVKSAAVPLAALTAWQGLMDEGQLKQGQRVLIHGASGGVGGFAVQIARQHGAYVIGTASAANAEFVRDLGANECLDYRITDFERDLAPVDMVFAAVGGNNILLRAQKIIKDHGCLVSTFDDLVDGQIPERHITFSRMWVKQNREQLMAISDLIDQRKIRVTLDSVYPLEHAVQAHLRSESARAVGKIVLNIHPSITGTPAVTVAGTPLAD
jgi:NADPH:quinone reductase-like Zn-dependent oxidoreductase